MEVDSERRYLLRETEQVDGGVEETGLELGVEVDRSAPKEFICIRNCSAGLEYVNEDSLFELVGETGDVDEGGNVKCELDQY